MELKPGSVGQEGEGELDDDARKRHFHVLAVDDSLVDRKLLERLLGSVSISHQVTFVDSGGEALQYLGLVEDDDGDKFLEEDDGYDSSSSPQSTPEKVNLIMTDYCMPGINGYDLLRRVKGSKWKDVPVVMMSSENIPSQIRMCMEGGAQDFLLKPLKLWDLERIQTFLLNDYQIPSPSPSPSPLNQPIHMNAQGNNGSDNIKDENFNDNNQSEDNVSYLFPRGRKVMLSPESRELKKIH